MMTSIVYQFHWITSFFFFFNYIVCKLRLQKGKIWLRMDVKWDFKSDELYWSTNLASYKNELLYVPIVDPNTSREIFFFRKTLFNLR